jgi:hypothetical protein
MRRFRIGSERRITVVVAKEAPAVLLDQVGALESWYDVEADARSGAVDDEVDAGLGTG